MKKNDLHHVAIIGAGAMGVAAFIALIRHQAAKRITLIDPKLPGQGIIYDCTDPELLCNTSVDLMAVLPVEFDDLLHYLYDQNQRHVMPSSFIPRCQAGTYVQDRFNYYLELAEGYGIEVKQVRDHALQIVRDNDGSYRIETNTEKIVQVSDVLVCNGYSRPRIPETLEPHIAEPSICISPYPERNLIQKMSPHHRILILGSKLSAVDASLVLCRDNHKVTMVSPSGELPAVRNHLIRSPKHLVEFAKSAALAIDYQSDTIEQKLIELVLNTIAEVAPGPLSEQIATEKDTIALLRKEIELAKMNKIHWEHTVFALVGAVNQAINPQDWQFVKKVKERYQGLLSRYVTAMPVENAHKLLRYMEEGCLKVCAGEVVGIERNESHWLVRWRSGEVDSFDAIVSAIGYYYPSYHATANTITLHDEPPRSLNSPELTEDFRVKFPGSNEPERIWYTGIAANFGMPVVNGLFIGVDLVNKIVQKIVKLQEQPENTASERQKSAT
ncbi:FAD/NAD(P)-binding protein [Larkinella bovis]|uniref:FAD/NAD(P)-binding protein n=1 Tax=Larkinella bovis TaxID=683041 RepID=A0ABW0I3J2_9BACT